MTLLVNVLAGLLLLLAIHRRPQAICATLAMAYLLAMALAELLHGAQLRPLLLVLDAGVVAACAALWRMHHSWRASIVAWIGMGKIAAAMLAAALGTRWQAWAIMENAAFFLQILVAGGMADGIMAWLGYRLRGLCSVRARMREHLGRFEWPG